MEAIDYLIIQSTDTEEQRDLDKSYIIEKHTSSLREEGFGWVRPGLDYLVLQDGTLETIINEANPTQVDLWGISEGKEGITGVAKHIAYVGGRTLKGTKAKDTRTKEQKDTLEMIVKFYILRFPNLIIMGLDEIASKKDSENPAFNVQEWLSEIGVAEQHIFKQNK